MEPSHHLRLLVGGVVVEDDVDDLAGRGRLDGVEEAALRTAAKHAPVEHVEAANRGGERLSGPAYRWRKRS
jgi:hypothetical protein